MEAGAEHPGARVLTAAPAPRVIGIDLGTTNCALAWGADAGPIRLFAIPQLVAAGEAARRTTLPSFLYLPADDELAAGLFPAPWTTAPPDAVAGVYARDHGALVPVRQVSSAKSWLSNAAVDRRAPLLPWMEDAPRRLSPVEASARLLGHLRAAWDHEYAGAARGCRMADLPVVLTVPASFDDEARELTLEAARAAELGAVSLLEEPLAALYAWIAAHPERLLEVLAPGALVLVCDVGGGTTDFSLIRGVLDAGSLLFERVAIGEHLLLGGDNLDYALAALVEARLPGGGLTLAERQTLRRKCTAAKERLLSEPGLARVAIAIAGGGGRLVGGGRSADLTREDVEEALTGGFLPLTAPGDVPSRTRRAGLRELGLPFESEPAVTRHLAAFLARAGAAAGGGTPAVPDAVLFNGGFFTPPIARERVVDALTAWSGRRPLVLENAHPDESVAIGAAFYGQLRLGADAARRRLLIRAGAPRAYYIGIADGVGGSAVCVMPRGTEEGTHATIDRAFSVVANQPATFTLSSSLTRTDPLGAVVRFDPGDDVHQHAPLVTALRYGRRSRRVPLAVRLAVACTGTGTLELWCESQATGHRWRLAFSLRAAEREPAADEAGPEDEGEASVVVAEESLRAAQALLRGVFGEAGGEVPPGSLAGALETAAGYARSSWPLPILRALADVLLETAGGRRRSAAHEARWLNLAGFCGRPGMGAPADPWRAGELRKVYAAGLLFPKDVQCQVEWLVLWQRVAAGFTPGQQQELAQRTAAQLGIGQKKGPRLNPQVEREAWRLLASLERIDAGRRIAFGDELAARVRREPRNTARVGALGRFGARTPLYGPLNTVVSPAAAERWIDLLLGLREISREAAAAIVQIGALTGDPVRDLSAAIRDRARVRLAEAGAAAALLRPLQEVVPEEARRGVDASGEALPEGLRLAPGPGEPGGPAPAVMVPEEAGVHGRSR